MHGNYEWHKCISNVGGIKIIQNIILRVKHEQYLNLYRALFHPKTKAQVLFCKFRIWYLKCALTFHKRCEWFFLANQNQLLAFDQNFFSPRQISFTQIPNYWTEIGLSTELSEQKDFHFACPFHPLCCLANLSSCLLTNTSRSL